MFIFLLVNAVVYAEEETPNTSNTTEAVETAETTEENATAESTNTEASNETTTEANNAAEETNNTTEEVPTTISERSASEGAQENNTSAAPTPSGLAINEENFPDSFFRDSIKNHDQDQDGYLSDDEINVITEMSFYLDSQENLNLAGIEKLTKIATFQIYGRGKERVINLENLHLLERLPELNTVYISRTTINDSFKQLRLPQLTHIYSEYTNINSLSDLTNFSNLKIINMQGSRDSNLHLVNNYQQLTSLGISSDTMSLSIPEENHTIQELSIYSRINSSIEGFDKFKKLTSLYIQGGQISDLSPIDINNLPAELKQITITGQEVESNNKYEVNVNYSPLSDISLPIGLDKNNISSLYSNGGTVVDEELLWTDKTVQAYSINVQHYNDPIRIEYGASVSGIYPKDYIEGEWLFLKGGNVKERFTTEEGKTFDLYRSLHGGGASHFANRFVTDGKNYTYSYMNGSDSTSALYVVKEGENFSDRVYPSDVKTYFKKDGERNILKTVSKLIIDGKEIQKEEISYVSGKSIHHDVTYTNLSDQAISDYRIYQMLDTMLNEDDAVPIYADGKGNAYIHASDFTLYLEKVTEGNIISAGYTAGPLDPDTAKTVKDYPYGTELLKNIDTAIYYGTEKFSLNPGESYSYSYRETIYIEKPILKASDKKILEGEAWDPFTQFEGVYDQYGRPLDRSKVEVYHQANPAKAGVYNITFVYDKVYSTVVKLTVIGVTTAVSLNPPIVELPIYVFTEGKQASPSARVVPNTATK